MSYFTRQSHRTAIATAGTWLHNSTDLHTQFLSHHTTSRIHREPDDGRFDYIPSSTEHSVQLNPVLHTPYPFGYPSPINYPRGLLKPNLQRSHRHLLFTYSVHSKVFALGSEHAYYGAPFGAPFSSLGISFWRSQRVEACRGSNASSLLHQKNSCYAAECSA